MRVLRCYIAVPPSPGGMERHIHELSVHQRRQGVEVIQVYSQGAVDPGFGLQVLPGWPILHLWPHSLRDLIFYLVVWVGVRRRGIRADVVHVHGDWSAFLLGRILKRIAYARVLVASFHGHAVLSWWRRALYRCCLSGYDVRYATGFRDAALLTELTRSKWHWITSGISECFFLQDAGAVKTTDVLVVGSIVPVKGMDLVVEIARQMPTRTFRVVGQGTESQKLGIMAASAGVTNLQFLGSLGLEAVAAEYARARILLSTSHREGTPTVMLEAMASCLPIVTTQSNDFAALLGDGEGGVVVTSRDPADLSHAIERFLTDEPLARRVGERNRLVATQYAWPVVATKVTGLMETALGEAGKC